jgi:hypothetical protein
MASNGLFAMSNGSGKHLPVVVVYFDLMEEQLKAVTNNKITNNKTILHTALQSALEKTRKEVNDLQSTANEQFTIHIIICGVRFHSMDLSS